MYANVYYMYVYAKAICIDTYQYLQKRKCYKKNDNVVPVLAYGHTTNRQTHM